MATKKIIIEDPTKTVTFTLRDDSDMVASTPKILEFLTQVENLASVICCPQGLDKWEVSNGLPTYDYYMKSKNGRTFTETVKITGDAFKNATHLRCPKRMEH